MDFVFSLDADALTWPPTTHGGPVEAGGLVAGPEGLLRVVETALGLGGPAVPAVRRIAIWRAKLAAVDHPGRFWHRSFQEDPFATARLLLGWRDSLVDAGWHADALSDPPLRLADLAAAESAPPSLPPGPADRLRQAILALRSDPPPEAVVTLLRLLDQRSLLPPGLRDLLDALEATGTRIVEETLANGPATGDLGSVKSRLQGGSGGTICGDGSFTVLEAETETAAAELVADRLRAEPDLAQVVLLVTRPTTILDAALRRRHLPRLGVSAPSPVRGILQALPLGLATRWAPFDARRMLEFLQLPRCPVPREIRRALIACLPDTPGRGGPAWQEAIALGRRAWEERLLAEEQETGRRSARRKRGEEAIAIWLEGDLADPERGLPVAELMRLCTALAHWAAGLAAQGEPLAAELTAQATALMEAVRDSGLESVPRIALDRMLDDLLAEGVSHPAPTEEAAPWGTATAPGAVWGTPRMLIWWGFDAPPLPDRSPWQAAEREALAAAGCLPWEPSQALRAASASWRRPILAARERVLLVAIRGTETPRHPLAHELAPLLEIHPALRPRAEALLAHTTPVLAGLVVERTPVRPAALPTARRERHLGAQISTKRETDSASALELLLGCPFAWVMRYRLGLRESSFAQIAEGERLIGLLAHRLAQEVLPPGSPPSPEELHRRAQAALPELIAQTASPLLQPGAAAEHAHVNRALPAAMERIGRLLHEAGLVVEELEAKRRHSHLLGPEQALEGTIDILLRDRGGRPALLDLKWSRALSEYRERIQEGRAVQLAAYAALVGAEERAAYVLLPLQEVVGGPNGLSGFRPEETTSSLAVTWQAVLESRSKRSASLHAGHLQALGIHDGKDPPPDPDEAPLALEPPCRLCIYGRLCGKEAVS